MAGDKTPSPVPGPGAGRELSAGIAILGKCLPRRRESRSFTECIGLGIDTFWDKIGQNEILPLFDPLFDVTVRRKLDSLYENWKIVIFRQKCVGIDTFWEQIGQNEI